MSRLTQSYSGENNIAFFSKDEEKILKNDDIYVDSLNGFIIDRRTGEVLDRTYSYISPFLKDKNGQVFVSHAVLERNSTTMPHYSELKNTNIPEPLKSALKRIRKDYSVIRFEEIFNKINQVANQFFDGSDYLEKKELERLINFILSKS